MLIFYAQAKFGPLAHVPRKQHFYENIPCLTKSLYFSQKYPSNIPQMKSK